MRQPHSRVCVTIVFFVTWYAYAVCAQSHAVDDRTGEIADAIFEGLDQDGDGAITGAEAREYIEQTFVGEFKNERELSEVTGLFYSNLDSQPASRQQDAHAITEEELEAHIHTLFQNHTVYDWVEYGLNLPKLAHRLRQRRFKAEDVPMLGFGTELLEKDLGVVSQYEQMLVVRATKRLVLGLGKPPAAPVTLQCISTAGRGILVSWDLPAFEGQPLFHSYLLEAQHVTGRGHVDDLPAGLPWVPVADVARDTSSVIDNRWLLRGQQYRLAAWSSYGRSTFVYTTGVCSPNVNTVGLLSQVAAWLLLTLGAWLLLRNQFQGSNDAVKLRPAVLRGMQGTHNVVNAVACLEGRQLWLHTVGIIGSQPPLSSRLQWCDYGSGNSGEMAVKEPTAKVLHMYPDHQLVWLVHEGGLLSVWSKEERCLLAEPIKCFNSGISALATGSNGYVWVGSKHGNLRCIAVRTPVCKNDGPHAKRLEYVDCRALQSKSEEVQWSEPGYTEATMSNHKHADLPDGRILGCYIQQSGRAHSGPVHALAVWEGRLYSTGGWKGRAALRAWHKGGMLIANHSLDELGAAPAVALMVFGYGATTESYQGRPSNPAAAASRIHRSGSGHLQSPRSNDLHGSTDGDPQGRHASTANASRTLHGGLSGSFRGTDGICLSASGDSLMSTWSMMGCYHLLSGHMDGRLLLWDVGGDGITPLVYLHGAAGRVQSLVVLPALKLLVAARRDGVVTLLEVPDVMQLTRYRLMPRTALEPPSTAAPLRKLQVCHTRLLDCRVCGLDMVTLDVWGRVLLWPMQQVEEQLQWQQQPQSTNQDAALQVTQASVSILGTQQSFVVPSTAGTNIIHKDELTLTQRLREGSFGVVYKGVWCGTQVAVKKLRKGLFRVGAEGDELGSEEDSGEGTSARLLAGGDAVSSLLSLQQEVNILASVRHDNVVLFLGICLDPLCIVTSYYGMGSLYDVLAHMRKHPDRLRTMTWRRRLHMVLDAARGMFYLHSRDPAIVHADLKSPNLLVDKDLNVKVGDFGLSRLTKSAGSSYAAPMQLRALNPRWLPPEVLTGEEETSTATDVYSFGIILWEVMTLQEPFAGMELEQVLCAVAMRKETPHLLGPDELLGDRCPCFAEYSALMQACWHPSPAQRPTFEHIMSTLQSLAGGLKPPHGQRGAMSAPAAPNTDLSAAATNYALSMASTSSSAKGGNQLTGTHAAIGNGISSDSPFASLPTPGSIAPNFAMVHSTLASMPSNSVKNVTAASTRRSAEGLGQPAAVPAASVHATQSPS